MITGMPMNIKRNVMMPFIIIVSRILVLDQGLVAHNGAGAIHVANGAQCSDFGL